MALTKVFCCTFFLISTSLVGLPTEAQRVSFRVPLRRSAAGHLLVRATLENRFSALFLLDTGASINLVTDSMARRLGMESREIVGSDGGPIHAPYNGGRPLRTVSIPNAKFGEMIFRRFEAGIVSAARLREVSGEYVDGILGLSTLKQFAFCLNAISNEAQFWPGGKLTSAEAAVCLGGNVVSIELDRAPGVLRISAWIDERIDQVFILDTGSVKTLLSVEAGQALGGRPGTSIEGRTLYGKVTLAEVSVMSLRSGSIRWPLRTVHVLRKIPQPIPALLGLDALAARPILFDLPAGKLLVGQESSR